MNSASSLPSVIQVIAPAPHGGAESVVVALAGAWYRAGGGGGVAVLMVHPDSGRFVRGLREQGVRVWEISGGTRGYRREVAALRALIESGRADLLHTHVYRADAVGFVATRRSAVPIVSTAHGFTGGGIKNRAYEWFDRMLLRRFDAVSCVSPALVERLGASGVRADRLRHLPNAIGAGAPVPRAEARRLLGLPASGPIIGWVGRLSEEKAPGRFVEAVARARSDCLGVVIGDGPLRGDVDRAAAAAPGRVRALGAVEGAGRLLSAFDALALSSTTEGTPMVLLEAMSAGVPIVSFAVGGVPALVGDTAVLVPPMDVDGLARAIDAVLAAPADAAARAARARSRAQQEFGEAQWVRAHAELYALAMR